MACLDCKSKIQGYCKVCQVLDDDNRVKQVKFCNTCDVYICEPCENDIIRRMEAFTKTLIPNVISKFKKKGK